MARTKITFDEKLLRDVIKEVEGANIYTAHSTLFEDVSSAYNKKSTVGQLNPQVIRLRVNELGIELKTPKGKRGRAAGCVINSGVKVPRADKIAGNKQAQATLVQLRKELKTKYSNDNKDNARFLPLVDKIEQGSMKAALKLMCLQCVDYDTKEVAMCNCTSCPLHIFRPYKK